MAHSTLAKNRQEPNVCGGVVPTSFSLWGDDCPMESVPMTMSAATSNIVTR